MNELQKIAAARRQWNDAGKRGILAHLVSVEGSHYRRHGARMILSEAGDSSGSVGGGCLDAELHRRIPEVLAGEGPLLVEYDSRSREDLVFGLGLGCGGKIALLLSPIAWAGLSPLDAAAEEGVVSALATVFRSRSASAMPGDQVLLSGEGRLVSGSSARPSFVRVIQRVLSEALVDRTPGERRITVNGEPVDLLVELVEPSPTLLLGGSGDEIVCLAHLAGALGWRVEVVVARVSEPVERRLGVLAGALHSPAQIASLASPRTAAIVATHNFRDDLEILRALVATPATYIGLLGSRDRIARLTQDAGDVLSPEVSPRIYGPAGLDIGAETPEEIALSILSEIQAVLRRRAGGSLRKRDGAIHERSRSPVPAGDQNALSIIRMSELLRSDRP